jgi:hypothetical protein
MGYGFPRGGDVQRAPHRRVVDRDHLLPGRRGTDSRRQLAVTSQKRAVQTLDIGQPGDRRELARGRTLQPPAVKDLRRSGVGELAQECVVSVDLDVVTQDDYSSADAILRDLTAAALAGGQVQAKCERGTSGHARPHDVHRLNAVHRVRRRGENRIGRLCRDSVIRAATA